MKKTRIAYLTLLALIALIAFVGCSDPTMNLSIDSLKTDADKTAERDLIRQQTWNLTYTSGITSTTENYTAKFSSDGSLSLTFVPSEGSESTETGSLDYTRFKIIGGNYYLGSASSTVASQPETQKYSIDSDGSLIIGDSESTRIKYTPVETSNGIRGRWTATSSDGSTKYTLVIGSTTFEQITETTSILGTERTSRTLTTASYSVDTVAGILTTNRNTTYDGFTPTSSETLTIQRPTIISTETITLAK